MTKVGSLGVSVSAAAAVGEGRDPPSLALPGAMGEGEGAADTVTASERAPVVLPSCRHAASAREDPATRRPRRLRGAQAEATSPASPRAAYVCAGHESKGEGRKGVGNTNSFLRMATVPYSKSSVVNWTIHSGFVKNYQYADQTSEASFNSVALLN